MATLLSRTLPGQRLARIGFAIDPTGVACAQVRRIDGDWKLASARVIPIGSSGPPRIGDQLPDEVATEFLLAAAGMKGGDAAVVLPMDCCSLRVLELPGESDDELGLMLRNELEDDDDASDIFGFWKLPARMSHHSDLHTLCAITAKRAAVSRTVTLLQAAGFNVVGVDGLPTAMARAVAMLPNGPSSSADDQALAIHIGWNSCTTVFVSGGVPSFARIPRYDGISGIMNGLANRLDMPVTDVLRMFRGIQSGLPVHPSETVLRLIIGEVERWSQPLCREILRGVSFSAAPGWRSFPKRALLMGPGCALPGLETIMEHQLNIATREWSLSGAATEATRSCVPGELAIAAAVSAWEVQ